MRMLVLFSILFCFSVAQAAEENIFYQAPYEIHYNTFNTSFIDEKTAAAYGIVRSKAKALLNVAVLKRLENGKKIPVSAEVVGQTYDLILTKPLDFLEVREQQAIYYLAQFNIEHKIPFYFTLSVKVDPNQAPIKLQFKKILWIDGKD